MSNSLLDTLLDTLDIVDMGTETTRDQKRLMVITLGFDKMGDKAPITRENIKAWIELRDEYFRLVENGYPSDSVRILLQEATFELISRCFTSDNATTLFDKLSLRWKL